MDRGALPVTRHTLRFRHLTGIGPRTWSIGSSMSVSESDNRVPQTYFLEDAAALARGSILARLDPTLGYQPFFRLDLGPEGPKAVHASWDYCDMAGRFVDALILTAPMVGAGVPSEAEEGLRTFLLGRSNPRDGLCYD